MELSIPITTAIAQQVVRDVLNLNPCISLTRLIENMPHFDSMDLPIDYRSVLHITVKINHVGFRHYECFTRTDIIPAFEGVNL